MRNLNVVKGELKKYKQTILGYNKNTPKYSKLDAKIKLLEKEVDARYKKK